MAAQEIRIDSRAPDVRVESYTAAGLRLDKAVPIVLEQDDRQKRPLRNLWRLSRQLQARPIDIGRDASVVKGVREKTARRQQEGQPLFLANRANLLLRFQEAIHIGGRIDVQDFTVPTEPKLEFEIVAVAFREVQIETGGIVIQARDGISAETRIGTATVSKPVQDGALRACGKDIFLLAGLLPIPHLGAMRLPVRLCQAICRAEELHDRVSPLEASVRDTGALAGLG